MALFHIEKFSCHVTLATFKRKLQHVGHKWSCAGHIQIVLWISGSNGSTGVTHFQQSLPSVYILQYTVRHEFLTGENIDEFDEFPAIRQYFPYQNFPFS